jgi:hypothetical protein
MKHLLLMGLLLASMISAAQAQSWNGTLSPSDQTRDGGQYMDVYKFKVGVQGNQAQKFTIRLADLSDDDTLDTFLIVESPSGERVENDDFDGDQTVSQVELIATEPGDWRVLASSYEQGQTGAYEVVVTPGPVGTVRTIEGRLDGRDQISLKGEYFDTHSLEAAVGTQFMLELVSLGFDGYLALKAPSGQFWRNDDEGGSTTLSRIGPIEGEAGAWTAYVTSASAEEVGAYDLRIITFGK